MHLEGQVAHIQVEVDALRRELVDEIDERAGRDRNGAIFLDARADPDGDPQFQIGCGQLQASLFSLQQHIAQNLHGRAGGHGASHDAQAFGKILLKNRNLHNAGSPLKVLAQDRASPGRSGSPARTTFAAIDAAACAVVRFCAAMPEQATISPAAGQAAGPLSHC